MLLFLLATWTFTANGPKTLISEVKRFQKVLYQNDFKKSYIKTNGDWGVIIIEQIGNYTIFHLVLWPLTLSDLKSSYSSSVIRQRS